MNHIVTLIAVPAGLLGVLGGCSHQAPAAATPASDVAHPVVGFALVKPAAPVTSAAPAGARTDRYEELGPVVDAMHGWSHASPR